MVRTGPRIKCWCHIRIFEGHRGKRVSQNFNHPRWTRGYHEPISNGSMWRYKQQIRRFFLTVRTSTTDGENIYIYIYIYPKNRWHSKLPPRLGMKQRWAVQDPTYCPQKWQGKRLVFIVTGWLSTSPIATHSGIKPSPRFSWLGVLVSATIQPIRNIRDSTMN